ncbi:ABC transporter ATP-binding protein [Methanobacterium alcaliphilum]|uniref:ABC transporter ATP-binding protein n=1 Tax=Methanobacterium alcaliphilum TaxID=392018 RepID=UPI00200ADC67|nr:ABC transporter ATP-binding protein [Methanobacterium alcaliphilum]MCK9151654.1 ABC transporter ATP-binding protein [Methanobacterium alcaliphilum]
MIKVENLSKTYKMDNGDKIKALNNINLTVESGEIVGIIGKSGSGKTTLLRILRGVETFDSGNITLAEINVSEGSSPFYFAKLKKATAIHLQRSFGLWAETVIQNVIRKLYGAKYRDEAMTDFDYAYDEFGDRAMELLELVGLDHKANHFAPVLSGGEKQRLIMARQLAKEPKVLLLDEPATMSCPKTKQEILDSIKKINKELGITVVVVSHLPEVHEYLDDRLILMENGEIKDEGTPKEIIPEFLSELEDELILPKQKFDEVIIKVKDLEKRFFLIKGGEVLELKDVNLDINKGEILSFIGPSGAGKTVLLRLIAGLDFPDSGDVQFKLDGDWVSMYEPSIPRMNIRRKLGFMHQEFALTHYATIKDQIASRLGIKGQNVVDKAKKKAEELGISDQILDVLYQLTDLPESEAKYRLEQIGLSSTILDELFPSFPDTEIKKYAKPIFDALNLPLELLERKSYELSGGQKVRATLALVLASKPEILILDEPFGDLDPITLRSVSNSLKKINIDFDTTIIMVSHHIDFIEELSTRSLMIEDGQLIMDGSPDHLCDEFVKRSKAQYLMNVKTRQEKYNS